MLMDLSPGIIGFFNFHQPKSVAITNISETIREVKIDTGVYFFTSFLGINIRLIQDIIKVRNAKSFGFKI
jgi:hypothetical protein